MGAVRLLVAGVYGTMCECFSIGLLLSHSLFCWGILEILCNSGIKLLSPHIEYFGEITQF